MANENKTFDISKSVRFDSRVLATIGKYMVYKLDYPITNSTDLIRTALDKLHAFIVAAGGEQITTYEEARQWFISQGLGDLFKQGNKLNKAHVRVSAKENELFASFSNRPTVEDGKPEGYGDLSEIEQQMVDALEEKDENVMTEREMTSTEPDSRRGDIEGLKDLMNITKRDKDEG